VPPATIAIPATVNPIRATALALVDRRYSLAIVHAPAIP
jgi:hypothetical protein